MVAASWYAVAQNPAIHEYLAILHGARNGFIYGAKVRFAHALVISILFGKGSYHQRMRGILRDTWQHASNLAKIAVIYKTALLVFRKMNGGKQRSVDSFIAGLLGGYAVFGERNGINEQVILYGAGRAVATLLPRAKSVLSSRTMQTSPSATRPLPPDPFYFSVLATFVWGYIMWSFENRPHTIQPGMFSSSVYIYRDSNGWIDWR
ncbi:peroxisomal membrane protein 4 [Heliocybe sulcata]|uniref:Peroxisomal membrane protein 4 n=1 Tax=Heliocybe sulcata TaxID=5364 RepID=A0A5C3MUM0_9AGAM|nr:peroxisomal membrane protein 4 [Heliocybe sulcata]